MIIFQGLVMAVFFLMELAALAAFGLWGFHFPPGLALKIALGIGTPLLIAILWGTFIAPKASIPVSIPVRALLQAIVFGLAALALYVSGKHSLAGGFLALAAVEMTLSYGFKMEQ
ncbi:YrdB family protein [Cohnella zeiphila]|uniref:YrdB family protein n=1 Tax=Cohnella zeiphila TaxID=2761120 RepID=A0A7X0SKS0_9BACL|nr:YrdB family protein [Cohnella zeiphila]MBB6731802.1 YrdB family protein [Cohnella zeiphila]